jgi:tetratricopeptide (TPR) repeat protein/outer membrane protein OmpA-like peptidoglycan-associated protein
LTLKEPFKSLFIPYSRLLNGLEQRINNVSILVLFSNRSKNYSMLQRGIWLLVLSVLCLQVNAQPSRRVLKKLAEEYMEAERYFDAKDALENLEKQTTSKDEYRRDLGICYFHTNNLPKAKSYLEPINEEEKGEGPEIQYYLGLIAHANHRFSDAIRYYKNFLRLTDSENPLRPKVKEDIRRCGYGVYYYHQKKDVLVQNLGPMVNSTGDDFAPVPSPNFPFKIYFSSIREGNLGERRDEYGLLNERSGQYCADMYSAASDEAGRWSQANPLSYLLNSPRHEVLLDFTHDGKQMYLFKGLTLYGGEIVVDTFKRIQEKTLDKTPFKSPMEPEKGDITLYFYNDSTLLFSSRRPGGYGGLDLYITSYNGSYWSLPHNLGPEINSPYDEKCPFLTKDGLTLYFSSNRSDRSFGGLDIFSSHFNTKDKTWSSPENLGVPINSSEDDDFFRLVEDGKRAYFSSGRKTGMGHRDIYQALFPKVDSTMLPMGGTALFYDVIKNPNSIVEETGNNAGPKPDDEKPEVIFEEIYYQDISELANAKNRSIIEKIGTFLSANSRVSLLLIGHTDADKPGIDGLYASMEALEKMSRQLFAFGIDPRRVQLKACGNNYPIVINEIGEEEIGRAGAYNSRIVYYMLNENREIVPIDYRRKNPPEVIVDQKGAFFEEAIKGLSFKIELDNSAERYEGEYFDRVPNPSLEKSLQEDVFHATVGLYQTFASAEELKKQLLKNGVENASVVVYRNGFRLEEKTISKLVEQFPDLDNYLSGTAP